MEKKSYHHGNLEEALIEAGLSLVDREGLERMSLRRVAAACEVSHAAPYKHFAGKEELLTAMQTYVEERFAAALEEAWEKGAGEPDRMACMARAYLCFFRKNPHYFSFFQRQQGGFQVNLSDLSRESAYRPFEVFKKGALLELSHLSLPREVEQRTIIAMWAMVHGCTAISIMDGVSFDGDWTRLLSAILQGNLGVRKGGNHFDTMC